MCVIVMWVFWQCKFTPLPFCLRRLAIPVSSREILCIPEKLIRFQCHWDYFMPWRIGQYIYIYILSDYKMFRFSISQFCPNFCLPLWFTAVQGFCCCVNCHTATAKDVFSDSKKVSILSDFNCSVKASYFATPVLPFQDLSLCFVIWFSFAQFFYFVVQLNCLQWMMIIYLRLVIIDLVAAFT